MSDKLQFCTCCDAFTGRREDESLYSPKGDGPLCDRCYVEYSPLEEHELDDPSSNTQGTDSQHPGFDEYVSAVRGRLDAGHRQYGNSSFERPISEIFAEIAQELLDVLGWGYILWWRLMQLARSPRFRALYRAALEAERTKTTENTP